MKLIFFLRYALNSLKHGGQRVIIATLAVAFGVMSLITLADIANAIERTLNTSPRAQLGGNLRISGAPESSLQILQTLQDDGNIDAYTVTETHPFILMRTRESGRANFIQRGLAIDPETYPLAGDFVVRSPNNVSLTELLADFGDALVTQDIAQRYNLSIGDEVRLGFNEGTIIDIPFVIRGIVIDNLSHSGSRFYYSLATAAQFPSDNMAGSSSVTIQSSTPDVARTIFEEQEWQVQGLPTEPPPPSQSAALFDLMLRGAGVLGLIVGGIGIANTMQVLLAKRHDEVGILKTLGYAQQDLLFLFILEATIIGFIGSLIGILIALLTGQGFIRLFANISTLLVTWEFNPVLLLMSLLTGITTTVIFSFYAIWKTSRIRPSVIFRRLSPSTRWRDWLHAGGFYALLSIPFALLTGIFLDSIIEGIAVILFAIIGFVVMGIIFRVLLWIILHSLPTLGSHLLRMARNNMRQRSSSMIFAMIALFAGIYTLGFATTIIQASLVEQSKRLISDELDNNLLVYTTAQDAPQIEAFVQAEVASATINSRYITSPIEMTVAGQPFTTAFQLRQRAWDMTIIEGSEFGTADGIYIPQSSSWELGTDAGLMTNNGLIMLPIIGRYQSESILLSAELNVPIISKQTAQTLGIQASSVHMFLTVPPTQENEVARQIGQAFVQTLTLTRSDVTAQINGLFLNLFGFALAMSGLALLAAIMLVANVVSLSMFERIFEIGILKAVGYTRKHLIVLIALEYSLMGIITSILALIGIQVTIFIIVSMQNVAQGLLVITPLTVIITITLALVLTISVSLLTAWQSLKIRPKLTLNHST